MTILAWDLAAAALILAGLLVGESRNPGRAVSVRVQKDRERGRRDE